MKRNNGNWGRGLIIGILVVLISFALVGTVAAADTLTPDPHGHDNTTATAAQTGASGAAVPDHDMMDTCQRMMANNSMSGSMMGARGMMSPGSAQMMESVEVNAMGGPMHDEMQGLVTKMMAGSISSKDQVRMVEIMNKYPGASNMMMTRMMGTGGVYSSAGMMDAGLMTGGSILIVLFFIVWLIVGILAIIWLIKQLQKDKIPS